MRKYGVTNACWLALLAMLMAVGCGQETVTAPYVVSTIATNGATGVAINTPISAPFNMAMKSASISGTTFTVTSGGAAVAGTVSSSGSVATFTPAAALNYGALYTLTITTGATNMGGTHLLANYVWTGTSLTPTRAVVGSRAANGARGAIMPL